MLGKRVTARSLFFLDCYKPEPQKCVVICCLTLEGGGGRDVLLVNKLGMCGMLREFWTKICDFNNLSQS